MSATSDYQHHCTLTYSHRDIVGNQRENTIHLIGTEAEIAAHAATCVASGLREGHGPYTFTPIHPASIVNLTKDKG